MNTTTSFLTARHQPIEDRAPTSKYKISPREQEVLHLFAYEHTAKEIGSKLSISYETVNSHRKNIMVKLGVKNTAGMVRVACHHHLLVTSI